MKLVRYEGSARVSDVDGALDGWLSGADARVRVELRGSGEALEAERGLVEARFKLDRIDGFSWMLGRSETEWTEWTQVRMEDGSATAFVEGSEAYGEVRFEVSDERMTMALTGRVDVATFLARLFVRSATFAGTAYVKYEGETEVPEEGR